MAIKAVLTGDIVSSTKLSTANEKKLRNRLQLILGPHQFEFYRGDSFQAYVKVVDKALQIALLCRTAAISLSQQAETIIPDVRLSIGIGSVKMPVNVLGSAKGEAFVLSGRAFEEMSKNNERLLISCNNELAAIGLQTITDYLNAVFKVMTGKQAAVIFELLKGKTQREVAALLKKSKSTIHQHVISGRWNEIDKLMKQYEKIVNLLT